LSRLVIGDNAPDLTLVLDLATEEALARAASRGAQRDRYESMGFEFHRRVRAAFLDIARAGGRRYAIIDAAPDIRRVQQDVRDVVRERLGIVLSG
jgi:dTMP kinase